MYANDLALGRPHDSADTLTLTAFTDCFRVDLQWSDGAHAYVVHDTLDEAVAHANRLGWGK